MSDRLRALYLEITKDRGKPLDIWEVAALLEVYGIRDVDAKREYGYENVFELAKVLYENYRDIKEYPQVHLVSQEEIPPFKVRVKRHFLKGLAFALPMLLQIVFTIVFGFALWSNIQLDVTDATVIALGTFLALIVSGGLAQIIGRKGLYYLKMHEYILSGKIMQVLLVQGFIKILTISLLILGLNSIFAIFSDYLLFLFLATFFLLSILFTVSSVYYVFEEYEKIFYFYLLGIFFVFPLHYVLGIGFPEAQFLAIAFLDLVFIYFAFKKIQKLKSSEESEGEILPRTSMLIFTLLPFYVYGVLYFLFLILDRLVAWNANSINRGFFVWFDVQYEIGSDLALLVLVLLMGLVEVLVYEFLYTLNEEVFKHPLSNYKEFNKQMQDFFSKAVRIFVLYTVGAVLVVFVVVAILTTLFPSTHLPFHKEAVLVFIVASIAFGFLTFALLDTLILFSFSRQNIVIRAIFFALLVNFFVGIVLANTIDIYFAVFGLLVGSIVFWYLTYRYIRKLLEKLDYFYYSAF